VLGSLVLLGWVRCRDLLDRGERMCVFLARVEALEEGAGLMVVLNTMSGSGRCGWSVGVVIFQSIGGRHVAIVSPSSHRSQLSS
jgi:hypothetical protein